MLDHTLLLNFSYEPLMVISWQRAITLLFLEKAEIVENYEDKEIRATSCTMALPSVIRLKVYVKRKPTTMNFSRKNIYQRDNYCCQYCGKKEKEDDLSFDHVIPSSQGGKTCWDNIVTACKVCNFKKGGRTPEEAGMILLSEPHKPRYLRSDHYKRVPERWKSYLFE